MRLLTHNLLTCHSRHCTHPTNFPLHFANVTSIEVVEAELNPEFVIGLLPKLELKVLRDAAVELGVEVEGLGDEVLERLVKAEDAMEEGDERPEHEDEGVIKKVHHLLLEVHVQDGQMVCPSCQRIFYIKDGIPNMLLAEHEIRK